ncbi:MAG: hypothetical protein E6J14_08125 [Chloroflexi bacterium]|nr:MAG: hypothetical protein E6J14_08125 [Chloroflexota bacterium]
MDLLRYVDRDMEPTSREFYRRLGEERAIFGLRCRHCGKLNLPPRRHCACGSQSQQWERRTGGGRVHAFTTQAGAFRFAEPQVIGLIDLDGGGRLFGVLNAAVGELAIGIPVTLDLVEVEGTVLLGFRPLSEGD